MAVVKNDFRVSRLGEDFSPMSRDSILSEDDELRSRSSLFESDVDNDDDEDGDNDVEEGEEDEYDDVDSGAGSDDFDLSDLGEIGAEFCQVGNRNCSIPFELYDLPDLTGVLSLDTWNNCLTEDERFSLAEYLPDMDQETFMRTLNDLLAGSNFHFGSPLTELFKLLKGGLCEPRVVLYRQGLISFEKRRHYHLLRKYQNSMVSSIIQIRDAWENCAAYSIEERLRLLNIVRSKKRLMYEGDDRLGSETDSSVREESIDGCWTQRGKDGRLGAKSGGRDVYTRRPSLDISSHGRAMTLEPAKYRKQSSKDILKVAALKTASSKKAHAAVVGRFPTVNHGLEMKSRPSVSFSSLHRLDRVVGYDLETARHTRGHIRGDDDDDDEGERANEMSIQKNRSMAHGVTVAKVNSLKSGKRQGFLKKHDSEFRARLGEEDTDSYIGMPFLVKNENFPSHDQNRNAKTMDMSGKQVNDGSGKKAKYLEKLHPNAVEEHMHPSKQHGQNILSKGSRVDWSASSQSFRHGKTQEEAFSMDHKVKFDGWHFRSKKRKMDEEFKTGKRSAWLDSKDRSYKTTSPQTNESYFESDHRPRTSEEKIRRKSAQNGGLKLEDTRGCHKFIQSEETESDSSEQVDKDEDTIHSTRVLGYPSAIVGGGLPASVRSGNDPKKVNKIVRKVKNEYDQILDGALHTSVKVSGLGEQSNMPEIEIFSSKGKKRGHAIEHLEKNLSTSAKLADDRKQIYKPMKNGQLQRDPSERSKVPLIKNCSERKLKGKVDLNSSMPGSNYMHGYASGILEGGDLHVTPKSVNNQAHSNVPGKKGQKTEVHVPVANLHERLATPLSGCNSVTRKRKGKVDVTNVDGSDEPEYMQSNSHYPNDEPSFSKKRVKKNVGDETSYSPMVTSDVLISERGIADLEPETKPLKKQFTLITPSVQTGFSFSIVHLLTAVRMAMITVHAEDTSEVGKQLEKNDGREKPKKDGHDRKLEGGTGVLPSHDNMDMNCSEHMMQKNVPSLTVQDIVDRVRSNPGDPCILETQEPLQDLIRGVLKIFSSKTAPLGAKGWKALIFYEKSTKRWSWIGPISSSSDHETAEEETSAEAWGVPHKMLVKLVDSFANWLKSGQETLQLIGSLPPPPVLTPNMDEKERFRDLRAQKSLITINPSSDEVRAYFRKEEFLRYSIPDRAFSYTATDGRKSIVAPLRRCGGKPTSKARDHFMLKPDRPPHVTILCLVRDAAARLPGSIGTRADVCTLLRDSQYIVEDVSDAQVNQIVSGALDRLHYERDPCVQFDGERKLWVYLHRDREEEDFEDDGTSSTKKWKRPRKDPTDQADTRGATNVVYQGTEDQAAGGSATGYDPSSEFNVEPSSTFAEVKTELVYNDSRPNMEIIEPFIDSVKGSMHKGHPMGWEVLELNPLREGKMLCQENSTNEDFDDEAFISERPIRILSASLM